MPKLLGPNILPFIYEPHHDKTNKMSVHPAKTQISLGIRPVWSESSLWAQWVAMDPSFLHADTEDWSDWADALADLSLRWAHTHFVGFVVSWLIYFLVLWDHNSFYPIQYCFKDLVGGMKSAASTITAHEQTQ